MTDEHGSEYFTTLPEGYRLASERDFMDASGRRKVDMQYLLLGFHNPVYQRMTLRNSTNTKILRQWIRLQRVYVCP